MKLKDYLKTGKLKNPWPGKIRRGEVIGIYFISGSTLYHFTGGKPKKVRSA